VKSGDEIRGYALERPLGRGETGATWLARSPEPGGREVVLKILDLGEARGWAGIELFGREVEALKTLSHDGIPRFIESFEEDSPEGATLVLAMELAPGVDLESASKARRFTEEEVSAILAGLADILAYLASLRPPVVHRDVNPRNVLLAPDGRVSLVDFSGAQEALRRVANPGATLIGSAGYIPLEQVSGRASTRSDLYGAAATALFLLTRRNPNELPLKNLKPDLGALPSLGRGLALVLDSWLEPDEARRSLEPAEAARILRGGEAEATRSLPPEAPRAPVRLPTDSRVRLVESGDRLEIAIPPAGLSNPAALGIGAFSLFWLAFVAFWTFSAAAMGAPLFFVLFSLPFWAVGIGMVRSSLLSMLGRSELVFDADEGVVLTERVLGRGRKRSWPIADLGSCTLKSAALQPKGGTGKELVLEAGTKSLRLGKSLSERELQALADAIERWRGERGLV
jgi:eukaryotic-like serine/threonine-protein kinase